MKANAASASGPDLDHRLLIVAGKGGVGRSTITAGLALARAEAGQSVLAVDAINDGGLRSALGGAHPNIELLELSTEASLEEYLRIHMKFPVAPSRLGPLAKIFDYVATAAPGVREILTIGKIAWEVREQNYDVVVVDAPATGHVVELIDAPANLNSLIGVGPLAEQTRWVNGILNNADTTGIVLTSLAEELPVTETLELRSRLEAETEVAVVAVVVNRVPPVLAAAGITEAAHLRPGGLRLAADVVADRSAEARAEIDRLLELELPIIRVAEGDEPHRLAAEQLGV